MLSYYQKKQINRFMVASITIGLLITLGLAIYYRHWLQPLSALFGVVIVQFEIYSLQFLLVRMLDPQRKKNISLLITLWLGRYGFIFGLIYLLYRTYQLHILSMGLGLTCLLGGLLGIQAPPEETDKQEKTDKSETVSQNIQPDKLATPGEKE